MLTIEEKLAMLECDIKRHEEYIKELKKQIEFTKKQKLTQFPIEVRVQNHPGQLLSE